MPIHDWAQIEPGAWRNFHAMWDPAISRALNNGILPPGYFALLEQQAPGGVPDVLALEAPEADSPSAPPGAGAEGGGLSLLAPPRLAPAAAVVRPPRPLDRMVTVRNGGGRLVAVIEVVSPGNTSSRPRTERFVAKTLQLIEAGIHFMLIDPWRPRLRTGFGLHDMIWRRLGGPEYMPPSDRRLTFASYDAGDIDHVTAYVVPARFGDPLPDLPLFLRAGLCVELPMEATYNAAFADIPRCVREPIERTLPPA